MTDYNVHKKNELTGYTIRMRVKNAEKFSPEVQQMFRDLAKSADYPKQAKLTDWEEGKE